MKKIAVIMATYNGADFIKEQIQSIKQSFEFCQIDLDYTIIIRDDGSTDETINIINNFILSEVPICLVNDGESLGFKKSFLKLIDRVNKKFDIVFFSDQDDIWRQDKVEKFLTAFNMLNNYRPCAVYSDLRMFGNVLEKPIRMSQFASYDHTKDSFGYWMFANDVTGAALAINSQAVNLLHDLPESVWKYEKYHDWLLIRAVAAVGEWNYIDDDLTFYRQHLMNVSRDWSKTKLRFPNIVGFYHFAKNYYWGSLCTIVSLKKYLEEDTDYIIHTDVKEIMQRILIIVKANKFLRLKYFSQLTKFLVANRRSLKREEFELFISILTN